MKKWLQYYLPVALTLFTWVTIKRNVVTDGGYDRLYGLPLAYISSSYAFSMSFDVYILSMILNVIFLLLLTKAIFKMVEIIGIRLKSHWIIAILGGIISLFWIVSSKELIFDFSP